MPRIHFRDRKDAGKQLAEAVKSAIGKFKDGVVIYALPRGGVVLGAEIAKALGAPLEFVITRKIGHQQSREFAIGAVSETGETLWNEAERQGADQKWLAGEIEKEKLEAGRRRKLYSTGATPAAAQNAEGKVAIVVDDGIATGLTFKLALMEIKKQKPAKLVAAVPVMPADAAPEIRRIVDVLVALSIDENYRGAVGAYYENFAQVSDEEVIALLVRGRLS